MKYLLFLIIIIIQDCKPEHQTSDENNLKEVQINYESNVYKLLNDAYKRNPKAPYIGEDAYINIYHDLNNSYDNIDQNLLNDLLKQAKSEGRPGYVLDKTKWANGIGQFKKNKFAQHEIEIPNLHFKDSTIVDVKKFTFFTNIDGVIFNNDYALLATNLYESLFFLSLYKLEDGIYKSVGRVNYPPSADE